MDKLPDIDHVIEIHAPVERVWEALSTPEQIRQWLGCRDFKAEIGHEFHLQPDVAKRHEHHAEGVTHCTVLALRANEELSFDWYVPERPKTHVSISLEARARDCTGVRLVHSGWDRIPRQAVEPIWRQLDRGWGSAVLPQLRDHVERKPADTS